MDWLHDLDDVVGQFILCFFHACAAPLDGPCMEKARGKIGKHHRQDRVVQKKQVRADVTVSNLFTS